MKPGNVLVGNDGIGRLSDLELSATPASLKAPPPRHTGGPASKPRKQFEGTPEYMAPEQLCAYILGNSPHAQRQMTSYASDVYALGITLNEVQTGMVPFTDVSKTEAQLHTVVEHGYTPRALCKSIVDDQLRPTLPLDGPLAAIIAECWAQPYRTRPNVGAALESVDAICGANGIDPSPDAGVRAAHLPTAAAAAAVAGDATRREGAGAGAGEGEGNEGGMAGCTDGATSSAMGSTDDATDMALTSDETLVAAMVILDGLYGSMDSGTDGSVSGDGRASASAGAGGVKGSVVRPRGGGEGAVGRRETMEDCFRY